MPESADPTSRWMERIETKHDGLSKDLDLGFQRIENRITALEASLPDRFLTRREWDVVIEAGRLTREASESRLRMMSEQISSLNAHGWWIAGAFAVGILSFAGNVFVRLMGHS